MNQDHLEQVELAKKLLKTVRHAAYATVNEDGTPHNSPLMLIHNDDLAKLYIGSYSESLHVKNLERAGQAFVVLFDAIEKNKGGIYFTASNAHECAGDELVEALRVHNVFRAKYGDDPLELSYYQVPKPSQRMYSIDISKVEVYSVSRREDGLFKSETRVEVSAQDLLPPR